MYIFFVHRMLFLLIIFIGGVATAQSQTATSNSEKKSYMKCMNERKLRNPICSVENVDTFNEALDMVSFLYQIKNFKELENALASLMKPEKRFASGDSGASAVYWAIKKIMSEPVTTYFGQEHFSQWKAAFPDSYFVELAEARLIYEKAWNLRGSGRAGSVSKESWELFRIGILETEQKLLDSSQKLKDTPLWDSMMLAASLDVSQPAISPQSVFERAVKRWPRQFNLYEARLSRLVPKWGGSWEQVEGFVNKWSRSLTTTEGSSMYARLYISLLGQGVTPDQTAMNWNKMKRGFDDLVMLYPDSRFKNLHASYACFARDKATFVKAMGQLQAEEQSAEHWLKGHSIEACMRWAGI